MIETIPLPRERILDEEPFQVRIAELTAWPEQEIVCRFEYNDYMDRWLWEMEGEHSGTVIPRSKCTLGRRYSIWPYMSALFRDKHGEATHISTHNLGEDVVLAVLPGPRGGSFLEEADISDERADRILKRHWFDPVG